MKSIEKQTTEYLRRRYMKTVAVQDRVGYERFAAYAGELYKELMRRYRAAIYKAACRVLRNNCRYPRNQFSMAAQFADAVINGSEIFAETEHYEIGSYYTKNHCPEIVYFD